MPTFITANIYSGRPDPVWQLTYSDEQQLLKILSKTTKANALPRLPLWKLGYRGFTVQIFDEHKIKNGRYHIFFSYAFSQKLLMRDKNSQIERFLLKTGALVLTENEHRLISSEIESNLTDKPVKPKVKKHKIGPRVASYPDWNPAVWNDEGPIQFNNNCYNYANNIQTGTMALPGRNEGISYPITSITVQQVTDGSLADHLIQLDGPATPANGDLICLVVCTGVDFHWYRLDSNNFWSHKPGQSECIAVDNSGQPITDPEHCDRGIYTDFGGYFNTIPGEVTIK